jgi:hypothetical protein
MTTSLSSPRLSPARSQRETLQLLRSQLGNVTFPASSPLLRRESLAESILPGGALAEGTLVELLAPCSGTGAWEVAFQLLKSLLSEPFTPLLIDNQQEFYPPGAAQRGVDLDRLIVVQPRSLADQLWALEQALRCDARLIVLSPLGRIPSTAFRRLKLAALRGKSLGIFVREASLRAFPSWADRRFLVEPVRTDSVVSDLPTRRYRVTALNRLEGPVSPVLLQAY